MLTRTLLISVSLLNILLTTFIWLPITIPTSSLFDTINQEETWAIFCPKEVEECFLLPLSKFMDYLGYSSSTFYSSISPFWEDILISVSVIAMLMMVSNIALFVYSTCYFKTKYCSYTIFPWLLFSVPIMLMFLSLMFFLMVDLTNSDRVKRELESGGYGVFAKTLSILMLMTLYLVISIMVVVVHLVRLSSSFTAKAPLPMRERG